MATAHYLEGRGVESDVAAVRVNPSRAMMTDTSKAISNDFSNCIVTIHRCHLGKFRPTSKLPRGSETAVYAPTSDKKPIANPDPLQRRASQPAPLQSSASDDGEWEL